LPIKTTKKPLGYLHQKTVVSIQKDKNDRVWVLSRNQQDSIECLYILKDSTFISARELYRNTCFHKYLIPYIGSKLDLSHSGNVIIGMTWGIIEFSESLKNIVLNDQMYSSTNYNTNGQSIV